MSTNDKPEDPSTETDELAEVDEDEVSGLAMGLPTPNPLGTTVPGTEQIHARKAGEQPVEYLKVTMQDVIITSVS